MVKTYEEVKVKRYLVYQNENKIIIEREPANFLRILYQSIIDKHIRQNENPIISRKDEAASKPLQKQKKNKKPFEKSKIDVHCSSCKGRSWFEFDER